MGEVDSSVDKENVFDHSLKHISQLECEDPSHPPGFTKDVELEQKRWERWIVVSAKRGVLITH